MLAHPVCPTRRRGFRAAPRSAHTSGSCTRRRKSLSQSAADRSLTSRAAHRYHPELQPIERVWCCVKNEIANNPVGTMSELKERLEANFKSCVTQKVLLGTWRKSVEYVEKYAAWSTDTEGCSWDPEEERERGEELPDQALAMDEEDLEEALEAAALDDLEEELE